MSVLFYVIRPCNGLDTIVSNGRKKTMFRLLLDTAVKTVAYRWQVSQIVETLVQSVEQRSSAIPRGSLAAAEPENAGRLVRSRADTQSPSVAGTRAA